MLVVTQNMARPDEVYAMLLAAHEGLSEEQSQAFNARLILLLANHVGDIEVLSEALGVARKASRELSKR
jgi:Protein of unknown function (DUF2783)